MRSEAEPPAASDLGDVSAERSVRFFYETSPLLMGTVALCPDGDILHLYDNPATSRFFGIEPGTTTGRGARSLGVPEATIRLWRSHYEAAAERGGSATFEYAHLADAGERILSVTVAPLGIAGPAGCPQFSYVAEDVTARRAAAAELRQAEERLTLATEASRLGVWEWRLDNDGIIFSARARAIYGFPEDRNPTYQEVLERLHAADLGRVIEIIRRARDPVLRAREPFEYRIDHPTAGLRWVRAQGQTIFAEGPAGPHATRYIGTIEDVTERRQIDERLRASEARLKLALDAGRMAVFDWPLEEDEPPLTPELCAQLGIAPAAVSTLEDRRKSYHPDDLALASATRQRALRGDERFIDFEFRYFWPNGEMRWLQVRSEVLSSYDGRPERLVGVQLDVTERRRAEEALRESENRLRLAMEAARMAVWAYDPRTDLLARSAELNRLLGFPPDAALDTKEVRRRQHPDDRKAVRKAAEEALQRGERFLDAQHRFTRPDGAVRWLQTRAEFILDPNGDAVRVIGVLMDVTDQKQAEINLLRSEANLRAALDAGALAIVDFDHLARRFEPSANLNALYGYPPERVLTLDDVRARYHPRDAARLAQLARSEHADPAVQGFHWQLEILLPDGATRWLEGRGEYIRDAAGQVLRSRGVLMDITDRKRSEERQRLLINELNHRVRNTLAIVQSLAKQTFRGGFDPGAASTAFEKRLMALSAAHNLLTREQWQAASLADVIASSVDAAAGSAVSRVRIVGPHVSLPPQTAVGMAMAAHELSTNALKYGSLSTATGEVEVTWTVDQAEPPRLWLRWRERGGPPVVEPVRRGFGSRLIERGLTAELGGSVHLSFEPEGVTCVIDAPLPGGSDLPQPGVPE
jgi:PAS domain S-box-containing protein